jgi:hypothetical protein
VKRRKRDTKVDRIIGVVMWVAVVLAIVFGWCIGRYW